MGYQDEIVHDSLRNEQIANFVCDSMSRKGSPGLVFVSWIDHAFKLAALISHKWVETHGPTSCISVPVVTSATSRNERKKIADALADGSLQVAVCTDVWATGIDIPPIGWVVNAGAGRAPKGLCQRGGRPTRLHSGKSEYVIYDILDASPHYEAQALERASHYANAGFNVDKDILAQALAKRRFGEGGADAQLDRDRLDRMLSHAGRGSEVCQEDPLKSVFNLLGEVILIHTVIGFIGFILVVLFCY